MINVWPGLPSVLATQVTLGVDETSTPELRARGRWGKHNIKNCPPCELSSSSLLYERTSKGIAGLTPQEVARNG